MALATQTWLMHGLRRMGCLLRLQDRKTTVTGEGEGRAIKLLVPILGGKAKRMDVDVLCGGFLTIPCLATGGS
jgi:hypothetical protein